MSAGSFSSAWVVEVNQTEPTSPCLVMMNGNYSEMIFPAYLVQILGLYWGSVGLEQKIDHSEPVWEIRWSWRELAR